MSLKVTKDNVAKVLHAIQKLAGQEVLVGIPATEAERSDDGQGSSLNNAQIGYILNNGSPAQNIPERRFLEPGVEDQRASITGHLQAAAKSALDGQSDKVDRSLNAAGLIASTGVRNKLNSGEFAPLAPSTIRNRHKSRGTASMRASEKRYLELIASGSSPEQAQAEAGIQPLVNTGQLRNSITYVIRKKE
ncbi:hypothetical protein A9L43_15985 [Pseudomonas mosselii]|uniref:hypothetical protein n=1 Tax=Pseudomonas mosselii TaxID=78327 RepID=UPI00083E61B8|nr:hypothetical protein [Pseudomonas mosselii]ODB39599.1 hypothetical protein A9L43_15985 [Pseudomonas mosselii]